MRNETIQKNNAEALDSMLKEINNTDASKVLETLFLNYIQTDEYCQSLSEDRKSLVFNSMQMYEFMLKVKWKSYVKRNQNRL